MVKKVDSSDLKGRDFLSLRDFSAPELELIFERAESLKALHRAGHPFLPLLAGKTLGMIFEKHSTRTRVSFEVGMMQLGGYPLFLSPKDLQLGRGEPLSDTGRVLSRYLDGLVVRTFHQEALEELAHHADIPVINALTDLSHPCQAMADLLTIKEHFGCLRGIKLAYVGDGNNVCHSLILGGVKMGLEVAVAAPEGYDPEPRVVQWAQMEMAEEGAGALTLTRDPRQAVEDAQVVYTDVWTSMGQEGQGEERCKIFAPYQVNQELMGFALPGAVVMHCLPAHRGEEITEEVMEGPQSLVWEQAENRLHVQKGLLALLL